MSESRPKPPTPEQLALAELLSSGQNYPVVRGDRLERLHLPITLWISDIPEEPGSFPNDYIDDHVLEIEYTPKKAVKAHNWMQLIGRVAGLGSADVQLLILHDQNNSGYLQNLDAVRELAHRNARDFLDTL